MFYARTDVNDFVRFVSTRYVASEEDVRKMVVEEYERLFKHSSLKKTKKVKEGLVQEALANCRFWLSEQRKQITPLDLVFFCVAKNYFTSIQHRI